MKNYSVNINFLILYENNLYITNVKKNLLNQLIFKAKLSTRRE